MEYFYQIPEKCIPLIKCDIKESYCYRLSKVENPCQESFIPQLFDPKLSQKTKYKDNPCECCGVSVFSDLDLLKEYRESIPSLGKYILEGKIISTIHGPLSFIYNENNDIDEGHLNWYQYKEIDPTTIFRGMENE